MKALVVAALAALVTLASFRGGTQAGRLGSAAGKIIDAGTGKPIVGATVVIESEPHPGATPPTAGTTPMATTRTDGTFIVYRINVSTIGDWSWSYVNAAISPTKSAQWVEVFPARGDVHVTYHGLWSMPMPASVNLGTIALVAPTEHERAWLAMVNRDRATADVPKRGVPLIFDDITLLAARRWARYMAGNGWYGHGCPTSGKYMPCTSTWEWEIRNHGYPSAQNIIYHFGSWKEAQRAFMIGRLSCPGRGYWRTCAYSNETGHYINTMAAGTWVGLAEAVGTDPTMARRHGTRYYDQEFVGSALPGEASTR